MKEKLKVSTGPAGTCRVVKAILDTKKPSAFMVIATLVVEDEAGAKWTYRAPYMVSDLEPYCQAQKLPFNEWLRNFRHNMPWWVERGQGYGSNLAPYYQAGKSIEEVYAMLDKRKEEE